MNTTIMNISLALIDIFTRLPIPLESYETLTGIRANCVIAMCMYTAVVPIYQFAFIHIFT